MKFLKIVLFIGLSFAMFSSITSCKKDDTPTTSCTDGVKNGDETGVDCGGTCPACPTCTDGVKNGDEEGIDCGGSCPDACPTCTDGIQNGQETGVDCGGPDCPACGTGIQIAWQSSGANLSPNIKLTWDSVWVKFNTDATYEIRSQPKAGGAMEIQGGTYTQNASGVGDIWDIVLTQTSPSAATSMGIFEITGTQLKYEVIQTNPPLGMTVTAPTAAAGFGSTNLGTGQVTAFIQKYLKL